MWPRRQSGVAGTASGAVSSAPPLQPHRARHLSFVSVNAMAPPQTVLQCAGAWNVDAALPDHGSESESGMTDSVDVMPCGWAGDTVSPRPLDAVARREQAWTREVLRRRELTRMNARRILAGADINEARLDGAPWASPAAMAVSYGYSEDHALAESSVTSAAAFSIARSLGLPPSSCTRMVRTAAEQAFWAWGSRSLPVQVPSPSRSRSPPCRTARAALGPRPPQEAPPAHLLAPWAFSGRGPSRAHSAND